MPGAYLVVVVFELYAAVFVATVPWVRASPSRVFHIFYIGKFYIITLYKYCKLVFLLKQNSRESQFKESSEFYSFFIFLL